MQLRTICDSVLYVYLSKVADTAEKRHYLHLLWTVVEGLPSTPDLDTGLDILHIIKILDLHFSVFQPYSLRAILVALRRGSSMCPHVGSFRSDPNEAKSSIMKAACSMHSL